MTKLSWNRALFLAALLGLPGAVPASAQLDSVLVRELTTTFKYSENELGFQNGVVRRDNSDIIEVDGLYYVWYTRHTNTGDGGGYNATTWYATSPDGIDWTEKGETIPRGPAGSWDDRSAFTPNILVAKGKYYLFYTAVKDPFYNSGPNNSKTAIGFATSDSPDGPWTKYPGNPVLTTSADEKDFDSHRVDDACLIIRDGKYWLYFKGRQWGKSPGETKMGVARADAPEGPYVKYEGNPIIPGGHEVMVWPHRDGVAALITTVGDANTKNTIQYAPDGLDFSMATRITNPPDAGGAYRPDAFTDSKNARGITWGISMVKHKDWPYLRRFEADLEHKPTVANRRGMGRLADEGSGPILSYGNGKVTLTGHSGGGPVHFHLRDLSGRKVASLPARRSTGGWSLDWNISGSASGLYLVMAESATGGTGRLLLLRNP